MTEITEDNFDMLVQTPVIISSKIRKQIIDNEDKARAYERLSPWILHVMDCYDCHKKGTDVCQWTRNKNKKDRDVEIVVLPDTIEEAQKALDNLK